MSYWKPLWTECTLDLAMEEVGITAPRDMVLEDLFKAGWMYDETADTLTYDDGDECAP
jgi:hypothetical protein